MTSSRSRNGDMDRENFPYPFADIANPDIGQPQAADEGRKQFLPLFAEGGCGFFPFQWDLAGQEADASRLKRQEEEEKLTAMREEAYKEGFQQGREEAYTEERKRIETALEGLANITGELSHIRRTVLEDAEQEILGLVLAIGKKAVLQEISLNRDLVVNAVRASVKKLGHGGDLKIRVNPGDLALVEERKPELLSLNGGGGQVVFIRDERVALGGCVVESPQQIVQYDPHLQIETILKSLQEKGREKEERP